MAWISALQTTAFEVSKSEVRSPMTDLGAPETSIQRSRIFWRFLGCDHHQPSTWESTKPTRSDLLGETVLVLLDVASGILRRINQ